MTTKEIYGNIVHHLGQLGECWALVLPLYRISQSVYTCDHRYSRLNVAYVKSMKLSEAVVIDLPRT